MLACLARSTLVAALLFAAASSRAELIYQPPITGADLDRDWQSAGSQLFKSAAKANEALAELELKRVDPAGQRLNEAQGLLKEASSTYLKIAKSSATPRAVSLSKLSNDGQRRFDEIQKVYGIKPPSNERESAQIASNEALRLNELIDKRRSDILKSDLAAVRDLLVEVRRLQNIGITTAELMTTITSK